MAVDDDGLASVGTLDLADAETQPLEPSPDLGGTQLPVQTFAPNPSHFAQSSGSVTKYPAIRLEFARIS